MQPNTHDPNSGAFRIHAAWRIHASAAALSVGVQIFLLGGCTAVPVCLGSAWIASLAALPACALIVLLCRRAAAAHVRPGRAAHILLAWMFCAHVVLAVACASDLAQQTLAPQTRGVWSIGVTLSAVLLCAVSSMKGASRLCFSMRLALPLLLTALSLFSLPRQAPAGLFPLLGAGGTQTSAAAACMLAGVSPALMLLLPPPGTEETESENIPVPKLGFFLRRMLTGALFGVFGVTLLSLSRTYESLIAQRTLGERLRIFAGPHAGIPQTLLILCQIAAIVLLAVNMLCAAEQALCSAFARLSRFRLGLILLFALISLSVALLAFFGHDVLFFLAPWMSLPAVPALILFLRKKEGKA